MGYCSETDIKKTIAQALTSATAANPGDLGSLINMVNIGREFDRNLVTSDIIEYYIQNADSEIDSILSSLYATPFCEKCKWEGTLYTDIDSSNPYIVLEHYCPLSAGDTVVLSYSGNTERHVVEEAMEGKTFSTESPIQYQFPAGTRVLDVSYADPVRFISARLSAANIYDKYFSSETAPNVSEFGEKLRGLAYDRLNDVLQGTIMLHGYHKIGNRIFNSNLSSQYKFPDQKDITRS